MQEEDEKSLNPKVELEVSENSRTEDGAAVADESGLGEEEDNYEGEFELEEDSEQEEIEDEGRGRMGDFADDSAVGGNNGYGVEGLTETNEDRYTYDEEEYYRSSVQNQTTSSAMPKSSTNLAETTTRSRFQVMGTNQKISDNQILQGSFLSHKTGTDGVSVSGALPMGSPEDKESNQALHQLKERLEQISLQKHTVDPDEVLDYFKKFHEDHLQMNNERLDLFFRNNKFLKNFSEQTDLTAVHECYRSMVVKSYGKKGTVFRYGTTGDQCYFILKGRVLMLSPEKVTVNVRTEQDLIKFYAENFDSIIWEKVEDMADIKQMARLYLDDPDLIEFSDQASQQNHQTEQKPFAKTIARIESIRTLDSAVEGEDQIEDEQELGKQMFPRNNSSMIDDLSKTVVEGGHNRDQSNMSLRFNDKQARKSVDIESDQTYCEEVWLFKKVAELSPGENFGETALVQTKPHLVTYQCIMDSEIASINREAYTRIVEKAVKRDLLGRISFLKSFRILQEMTVSQLEKMLFHVNMTTYDRGKVIYKVGDRPCGVYMVQEGAFELSRPGKLKLQSDKLVDSMKVDPMAKFQLRKQAGVIKDFSRAVVKLAILGAGEVFGLEECSVRPQSTKVKNRGYTVTCVENNSKVIFISHQVFADKVMNDPNVERSVKFDCAIKDYFHNSRELQHQQTVWNGNLIGLKQIQNAAEKADAEFEERIKLEGLQDMAGELKGMPKLNTLTKYYKDKFETEVLNKIVGQMHERSLKQIDEEDPEVQAMIVKKISEVEKHFDQNVDVINAERKAQKNIKAKLAELKEIEKVHLEQHNLSMMSKQHLNSIGSNAYTGYDASYLQQDSIMSQATAGFQGPAPFGSLDQFKPVMNKHHVSVDDGNLKVIHSVVKEKRPFQSDDEQDETIGTQPKFNSMDQDISLKAGHQPLQPLRTLMPQSEVSETNRQKDSMLKSPFGLESEIQTIKEGGNADNKSSIVIEHNYNGLSSQLQRGAGGLKTGQESDAAEFKGLQGSQANSNSNVTPIILDGEQTPNDYSIGQNTTMNRTQNAFNSKEKKLLEMFNDEQGNKEKQQIHRNSNNVSAIDTQRKEINGTANSGGIIISTVTKQGEKDAQFKQIKDKLAKLPTETFRPKAKEKDQAERDVVIRELSETTANPSNLGNMSNIRDPRYSQEFGSPKSKKMKHNQRFGINIPKVKPEKEGFSVQEEANEDGGFKVQAPQGPPFVAIKTRMTTSRSSQKHANESREPDRGTPAGVPAHHQGAFKEIPQHARNMFKPQGPVSNELPFNDYSSINRSGLKGHKRNQVSYISRTINDKQMQQKLKLINKDSANQLPQDQLDALETSMQNTYTANMPEVYNYSQSIPSNPRNMFPPINSAQGVAASRGVTLIQSPNNSFLQNADISMIDTAQMSAHQSNSPTGAADISRIVDTNHSNREVFVPSQINPRMKRKAGVNKVRIQQDLRQVSAKSNETKLMSGRAVKGGSLSHKRGNSYVPQSSVVTEESGAYHHEMSAHATSGGKQGLDQTTNSFGKQMQNPDDTQYRTAIMREARQQQMMMEAARSAAQSTHGGSPQSMSEIEASLNGSQTPFGLGPAAAAAAAELIQRFFTNPNEPISTEHFLHVQRKYELPPFEAYQLLLHQIQFQKALLTPPTAATVVKVSHGNYTTHLQQKREEVISFRNNLHRRYTYMRKKSKSVSKPNKMSVTTGQQTGPVEEMKTSHRSGK